MGNPIYKASEMLLDFSECSLVNGGYYVASLKFIHDEVCDVQDVIVPLIVYDCMKRVSDDSDRVEKAIVNGFLESLIIRLKRYKFENNVGGEWVSNVTF